jgi:hypothetical protein
MKPRVLKTYKILAVALAATGCASTTAAGPEPARSETPVSVAIPTGDPAQAETPQAAPKPAEAQPAPSAQAPMAPAGAQAIQNAVSRPESQDPKLLALRNEVVSGQRSQILSQVDRYRPLCDKDGYPLVGNLHRKGPSVAIQPSEVCAQIRNGGGVH